MSEVHLQIPAQADYLELVRLTVFGIASKLNLTYEDIEDLKVAVSEACNQAILHAELTGNAAPGELGIRFDARTEALAVTVKAPGSGAFLAAPSGSAEAGLQAEASKISLGFYLMKALMDEVEVDAQHGMEVTLIKYTNINTTT
ncbi:ATP-binding protein [Paenibacillus oryzisoli]|uniref:ATP-binding protein n=1 Tax=Paenibacillus oryzisoli TaxID=1850517 RepID=UPI003D289503